MTERTEIERTSTTPHPERTIAARVALTYAAATTVWILGSGYIVLLLPERAARYLEISKGLLFGVVTTVLLYLVILRWAKRFAVQAKVADIAEQRVLQVIQAVPVGVLLADADGLIEYLNPEAARILGIELNSDEVRMLADVMQPRNETSGGVLELLRSGRLDGLAVRGAEEVGDRAFVATAARLGTEPHATGWVLAFADVTGTHLENRRIRRLVAGYRVLSDALNLIQTARNTRQLLVTVSEILVEDGLTAGVWAAAPDPHLGRLATVASRGLDPTVVKRIEEAASGAEYATQGGVADMLLEGHLYVVNDVFGDTHSPFEGLNDSVRFGSSATFQVTDADGPLAVMSLFAEDVGFFDQEQIRLVEILREAIVFAVSKFELDSKRVEAEESLEASERAYRQMFKQNPEPMWVYDRSTLAFLAVNDDAIRKYGYTAEEFETMTIIDIRPPEDIPRLLHSVAHHMPGREDSGYWTHIDKSGHTFAVFVQSNSISWNGVDAQLVLVQEVATI
jgi:PAS domain S-box-containing protein